MAARNVLQVSGSDVAPILHEAPVEQPIVRPLLLCFMFMFQGYGVMNGNPQHALKGILNITHEENPAFLTAVASFQLAKLTMRVLQIGFLVFVQPNGIVYLAYAAMFCGCMVPIIFVYAMGVTDLWVVYLQYSLGGIAVGLFEGTFLSVISTLGKNTKTFVIMGAPMGFAMHNIVLGTFAGWGMPTVVYYVWSAACMPIAVVIFAKYAPAAEANSQGKGCQVFINSLCNPSAWLLLMLPWLIAKFFGNFVLEDAFPLFYSTFEDTVVPLWGPTSTMLVPTSYYLAWYWFVCMALGDALSRRAPQYIRLSSWKSQGACIIFAIAMCVVGEALNFLKIAAVNGPAVFLAFFGNGFIYGLSAKFIDTHIPQEHRYAAYNLWCFFGDLGGYAGQSSLANSLSEKVCAGEHYDHMCCQPLKPHQPLPEYPCKEIAPAFEIPPATTTASAFEIPPVHGETVI